MELIRFPIKFSDKGNPTFVERQVYVTSYKDKQVVPNLCLQ